MNNQRVAYQRDTLPDERRALLMSLPCWDSVQRRSPAPEIQLTIRARRGRHGEDQSPFDQRYRACAWEGCSFRGPRAAVCAFEDYTDANVETHVGKGLGGDEDEPAVWSV